jgi:hypothetical protein
MISLEEYFGKWHGSSEQIQNAIQLLVAVNNMHDALVAKGITFPYNPITKSLISGEQYGGFRPASCTIGAPKSAHKEGRAVDIYDPTGEIDVAIMADQVLLQQHGLYIEHPDATKGWSHWSNKPPKSGKRVFYP